MSSLRIKSTFISGSTSSGDSARVSAGMEGGAGTTLGGIMTIGTWTLGILGGDLGRSDRGILGTCLGGLGTLGMARDHILSLSIR